MTNNAILYGQLLENTRSHLENERQGRDVIAETKRHNLATEDYANRDLSERTRHNIVTEDIGYKNLNEQIRHNTATEYETNRHNRVTEDYQFQSLSAQVAYNNAMIRIGQQNANTASYNAVMQAKNAAKANRLREKEINRNYLVQSRANDIQSSHLQTQDNLGILRTGMDLAKTILGFGRR